MADYRCLLEIAVRHGYYVGEGCPGLRFVPTPDCLALIDRVGGLARTTPRGLVLLGETQRIQDWLRDGAGEGAVLSWSLRTADEAFSECTAHCGQPRHEVLLFDAENAVEDTEQGYRRLHGQHAASAADRYSLATAAEMGSLDPATVRESPCGLVRLPLRRLQVDATDPARLLIRFAPRALLWKYCLVGDWPEPGLHVVDLAQQVRFEAVPARRLADGRSTLAFRSTTPVELHQHPCERFQLRSRGPTAADGTRGGLDRAVVKRLPAAAPRHFSREVIGGANALVSEIFVHR